MRKLAQMKKYAAVVVVSALSASPAFAAGPVDAYFAAVDLASVATAVSGIGVVIVGITMAIKGIGLAKRVVSKA